MRRVKSLAPWLALLVAASAAVAQRPVPEVTVGLPCCLIDCLRRSPDDLRGDATRRLNAEDGARLGRIITLCRAGNRAEGEREWASLVGEIARSNAGPSVTESVYAALLVVMGCANEERSSEREIRAYHVTQWLAAKQAELEAKRKKLEAQVQDARNAFAVEVICLQAITVQAAGQVGGNAGLATRTTVETRLVRTPAELGACLQQQRAALARLQLEIGTAGSRATPGEPSSTADLQRALARQIEINQDLYEVARLLERTASAARSVRTTAELDARLTQQSRALESLRREMGVGGSSLAEDERPSVADLRGALAKQLQITQGLREVAAQLEATLLALLGLAL